MKIGSGFVKLTGIIAAFLFLCVAVFQLLVLFGVFPVSMTWGGQFESMNPGIIAACLIAFFLLTFFACIIWVRAGLAQKKCPSKFHFITAWVITLLMFLNIFGNITSKSHIEKIIFTPVTILLFLSCLIVSISKR